MILVVPKLEIPNQLVGTILMNALLEKHVEGLGPAYGAGIARIARVPNVPNGFRLQFTKQWADDYPDDAIIARAANILIGGEPLIQGSRGS